MAQLAARLARDTLAHAAILLLLFQFVEVRASPVIHLPDGTVFLSTRRLVVWSLMPHELAAITLGAAAMAMSAVLAWQVAGALAGRGRPLPGSRATPGSPRRRSCSQPWSLRSAG